MASIAQRAVLFDLDGTLLHTAPDLAGAVNDMRAARGLDALALAELAPLCSFGGRGMLYKGLDITPEDDSYAENYALFIATYQARMTRDSHPYEGVRELLVALAGRGIAWGVVTNKVEYLARPLIETMAFEPPPGCIIGGDTAGAAKPDPAPILLACERMGVAAKRCLYVGDSDRDMAAGIAAGMPTIAAAYGYVPVGENTHDWPADAIAHSVADLLPAIEQLLARAA